VAGFATAAAVAILLVASSGSAPPRPGEGAPRLAAETARVDKPRSPRLGARGIIEDLASVVARRYRISGEATQTFVETAFREARRHELDPLLVLALIAVESRFNPVAQSEQGALGLMQIIPRFHRDKLDGARDGVLLDPRRNIELGTRVLKEYIRRAGNEDSGLQLYNGAAADTTQAYAGRVKAERERLRRAVRRPRDDPA
jgi:soluble lytic murein transglycosylase-like protein